MSYVKKTHRFGLLTPSSNTTQEPEFSAALPPSVSLHTGRVAYRDITPEEQMRCVLELESESRKLADAEVDAIVFAATAPTLAKGKGYDRELIKRMEDASGKPATTAATAFVDALTRQPADFSCHVVETEFWGAMATPNLMVESSVTDLADMMTALSFHVGEVQRNPYHLLVPAWMQDNVRRGGELVGGQGGAAPDFVFCTLYRLRQWSDGQLRSMYVGGRTLPADVNASTLFGPTPS